YQVPIIHRCVVPMPPSCLLRGDRCLSAVRRGLPIERWFHPTTAFNEQVLIRNTKGFPKSPLCSNALVTMVYLGKSKHVSLREYKDEIRVYQQHCGTENICVYKGELLEGDTFQFISKRYLGFPFSLTFYLNGLQVERLSCCCEFRGVQDKRQEKCDPSQSVLFYRCLVAMGLDKKLCPSKRNAWRHRDNPICYWGCAVPCTSSIEQESKEDSESITVPSHEASKETVEETLETEEESSEEE
ncbi:ERIC3 protein, partial [Certhia familiaris]|nr:ERIC3 protein [Certhia familiaris]